MKILVVDDDLELLSLIGFALRQAGYLVVEAADGGAALATFEREQPDLVILDVNLPVMSGFDVCRRIRAEAPTPIMMLTVRSSEEDQVRGLDGGADDYLTKPFSYAELLARLRALVRRGPVERPTELRAGDLRLDPARRRVWRADTEIALSTKEFSLLETFMRHSGEVLSRFQLLEHAWDYDYENRSNVVDSYVRFLRQKIDKPFGVESIETVRGAGYRLREDGGC